MRKHLSTLLAAFVFYQGWNLAAWASGGEPAGSRVFSSAFSSIELAAAAANGKTLVINNALTVDRDTTIDVTNGCLCFEPPGRIILSPTSHIRFVSPVSAPPVKIFEAAGTNMGIGSIRFTSVEHIYPEWWGAVADEKTDNTASFQQMFDSTYDVPTGSYQTYTFLQGRYLINGTVTLDPSPVPPTHFGIQTAPTLLGAGMGSVNSYLGIGTTFIKNTTGPMFVIAGTYDAATDRFTLDPSNHVNPKYFTTERIRFTTTLPVNEVIEIKPMGILGESRHSRFRDSIFTRLWRGIDNCGYSDYSLYDGCIFDCCNAVILRSPDATAFIRCQFGESFVLSVQKSGKSCGPAITMMGGDVKLVSCSMNYYKQSWAINLSGTGFPVLSIDDLHAEGCLVLNANCTPFKDTTVSGARISIANSRIGGNPKGATIKLDHVDGEIVNSVFYELQGRQFPPALFSVSDGELLIRRTSFIQELSASPYEGKAVMPGFTRGTNGSVVFQ